ncbi:hypothetical protein GWR56_10885 [Mucilaginibacter sp. 14171R-50]|uniref:hypothetical protein n=1 Tax=Mucilaginibacter sp. 14171R-50 TaxID=2703789 RepID=UPI00138CA56A|nr:hypothetical protein [Mucilaginibacter sp. 14171R-50]QHS56014.1 hypothetical protein GWR56_10885 [Mucilaginibacter sp. 14171R-50]
MAIFDMLVADFSIEEKRVIASDSVAIFDTLIADLSIEDCFVPRNDVAGKWCGKIPQLSGFIGDVSALHLFQNTAVWIYSK